MARSAVELDFFRMEKQPSPKPQPPKLFDRRRSFRDIQGVISKLNPEVLKAVIASGSVDKSSNSSENCNLSASSAPFSVPSTPKHDAFPVQTPALGSESTTETAKMTIFYNGVVTIFEVPRHKAENILKIAGGGVPKIVESADPKLAASSEDQHQLLKTLNGDLPIARRKSLKRFLEKRKERVTLASPYGCPQAEDGNSGKSASGGRNH
ncbi:hypothetical protein NMG60_11024645 [Bertholletia excelsa]